MWSKHHTGEKHEMFLKCTTQKDISNQKPSELVWNVPPESHQRDTDEAGPASPVQLVLLISSAGRFVLRVTASSVRSRAVKRVFSKFFSSCSELEEAKRVSRSRTCASRSHLKPYFLLNRQQETTAELPTRCSGTEDVCWPASGRAHAAPPTASPWRRRLVCRTKLSPCKRWPTITDLSSQLFSRFIVSDRRWQVCWNFNVIVAKKHHLMPQFFCRSSFIALVTHRLWAARGPKKCSYLQTTVNNNKGITFNSVFK